MPCRASAKLQRESEIQLRSQVPKPEDNRRFVEEGKKTPERLTHRLHKEGMVRAIQGLDQCRFASDSVRYFSLISLYQIASKASKYCIQ